MASTILPKPLTCLELHFPLHLTCLRSEGKGSVINALLYTFSSTIFDFFMKFKFFFLSFLFFKI